jgi:hypothetical protein
MKYPLTDATLTTAFPVGISNRLLSDRAAVRIRGGLFAPHPSGGRVTALCLRALFGA